MSTEVFLIGGVGYTFLGDLSFGPVVVERLQAMEWPSSVAIEDVSYNPMTVMDWLRDDPSRFDRAIFLTAVARGRMPGTLHRAAWTGEGLSTDRVQAHVAEAVTGSIGLDNLLVIGSHFGLLPRDITVVELEPASSRWGEGLSSAGEERASEVIAWLRTEADAPVAAGVHGSGGSR